jgi:hypothetical protein
MPLIGRDPRRFGQNGDIDLLELVGEDFPVHARIDYGEVVKVKEEATACHASQGSMGTTHWLARLAFRMAMGKDLFIRAYPAPDGRQKERDLFAGIRMVK